MFDLLEDSIVKAALKLNRLTDENNYGIKPRKKDSPTPFVPKDKEAQLALAPFNAALHKIRIEIKMLESKILGLPVET